MKTGGPTANAKGSDKQLKFNLSPKKGKEIRKTHAEKTGGACKVSRWRGKRIILTQKKICEKGSSLYRAKKVITLKGAPGKKGKNNAVLPEG